MRVNKEWKTTAKTQDGGCKRKKKRSWKNKYLLVGGAEASGGGQAGNSCNEKSSLVLQLEEENVDEKDELSRVSLLVVIVSSKYENVMNVMK